MTTEQDIAASALLTPAVIAQLSAIGPDRLATALALLNQQARAVEKQAAMAAAQATCNAAVAAANQTYSETIAALA